MAQKTGGGKRISDKNEFWLLGGLLLFATHIYVYLRIRDAIGVGWISAIWLVWSVSVMTLPYVTRRTDKINHTARRKWSDRVGATGSLYAFYVFVAVASMDLLRWLTGIGLPPGLELAAAFAAAAMILSAGVRQANVVQTVKIVLPTDKMPRGVDRLRIVQLSDLHLGPFTGALQLARIARRVREAAPDIVVVTGDLADGPLEGRKREQIILRRIKPRFGTYAVPGNHDYYDDIDKALSFMESAGMKALRGQFVEVAGIVIAGADDRDHEKKELWGLSRSETLLLSIPRELRGKFVLFLRHKPVVEAGTVEHFDLQLSGHTHGGQLLPHYSSRHMISGRSRGLKKLSGGGYLYISNGAGYVGPPVRFLAPAEIVVIDLVRKNGAAG